MVPDEAGAGPEQVEVEGRGVQGPPLGRPVVQDELLLRGGEQRVNLIRGPLGVDGDVRRRRPPGAIAVTVPTVAPICVPGPTARLGEQVGQVGQ